MSKYFDYIATETKLTQNTGSNLKTPPGFFILSSAIISQCVFIQSLIQQVIYTSHGPALSDAKRALKQFPSPRARVDFLCSFPYSTEDSVISKVFDYSRALFRDLYDLRNILAHELWGSSENHQGVVLFSTLDENSRLLMASGRLWHEETTPQEVYDATIRFIRNVKTVSINHLKTAIDDINICSWSLMNINAILSEKDPKIKGEARRAFLIFHGTSHLFDDAPPSGTAKYSFSNSKSI